jgi:hypothetical protein
MLQIRHLKLMHALVVSESVLDSTTLLTAMPASSHNSDPVAQTKWSRKS